MENNNIHVDIYESVHSLTVTIVGDTKINQ